MDWPSLPSGLGPLDGVAALLVLALWGGTGLLIEHPPARRPSVTVLMTAQRMEWMRRYATRPVRIFDSQILATLRQGTAFFASTAILAIGGVLAFAGNADALMTTGGLLGTASVEAEQLRLVGVALILVAGFLRFVWANRIFGYCSVVMAAVPDAEDGDPQALAMAARAGRLNVQAALNFNRGLRALYFALAGLAWLAGPVPLMVAALLASGTLMRREFASVTHAILKDADGPGMSGSG